MGKERGGERESKKERGGLVGGRKTGYHSETVKLKNKKKKRILISMVLDHELDPL